MSRTAFTTLINKHLKAKGWKPKDLVDHFARLKETAPDVKTPSHNTVYQICNGRLPYQRVLAVLAAALEVPAPALMEAYQAQKAATKKKVEVVVKEQKLPRGEEALLKAYRALPNHRKKQLQDFATFLSKSVKG